MSKFAYFYINNKEDFTKELKYFDVINSFIKKRKKLICVIESNDEYTYKTIAVNLRQYINRIELSWSQKTEIEINNLLLKGGEKE